jgi:hypothetical protein
VYKNTKYTNLGELCYVMCFPIQLIDLGYKVIKYLIAANLKVMQFIKLSLEGVYALA